MNRKHTRNIKDLQTIDEVTRWTAKEEGIKYGTKAYDNLFREIWQQLKDV